mmetsp:Transcript_19433/g.73424  ORF Transcript_19433/g.73424 Transcript_19433/m.73424 type:complete len:419 (+) Transcript_19433:4118-5374(+)
MVLHHWDEIRVQEVARDFLAMRVLVRRLLPLGLLPRRRVPRRRAEGQVGGVHEARLADPDRRRHQGGPHVHAVRHHAGEGQQQQAAELVIWMLQAHGEGLEVGGVAAHLSAVPSDADDVAIVADAVAPHVRLDELVLAQFADLEQEVGLAVVPAEGGLLGEDDGVRALGSAGKAGEHEADAERVEENAAQQLRHDDDQHRPALSEVVVIGAVADGRHGLDAEVGGADEVVDVRFAVAGHGDQPVDYGEGEHKHGEDHHQHEEDPAGRTVQDGVEPVLRVQRRPRPLRHDPLDVPVASRLAEHRVAVQDAVSLLQGRRLCGHGVQRARGDRRPPCSSRSAVAEGAVRLGVQVPRLLGRGEEVVHEAPRPLLLAPAVVVMMLVLMASPRDPRVAQGRRVSQERLLFSQVLAGHLARRTVA